MRAPSRSAVRAIWAAIIIATTLFFVLLLAPQFIRRGPIENKIRSLMARHTGDAVLFDRIDLSLLPRPQLIVRAVGITFRDTVTGTVGAVRIYPEILPLFLGRIHIAKVILEQPDLVVEYSEHARGMRQPGGPLSPEEQRARIANLIASIRSVAPELAAGVEEGRLAVTLDKEQTLFVSKMQAHLQLPPKGLDITVSGMVDRWGAISAAGRFLSTGKDSLEISGLSLSVGRSSLSDISGRIIWEPAPTLDIASGRSVIFLQDLSERLFTFEPVRNALSSIRSLKGSINLAGFTFAGPLLHPGRGTMNASGSVANIIVDATILPGPLTVRSGAFTTTMDSVSATDAHVEFLDASFTTSIHLSGLTRSIPSIDVSIAGNTGPETARWASAIYGLPPQLTLRAPLSLSQTRFQRQENGSKALRGTLQVQNGPRVSADIHWDARQLLIKRLDIQDERSTASLTLLRRGKLLDVSFAGNIFEQTLNNLFEQSSFRHGSMQGDLKAHLILDQPQQSRATGRLEGRDILIPGAFRAPLEINTIQVIARGRTLAIASSDLTLADMHFTVAGSVTASARSYLLDGDIGTTAVAIESLRSAVGSEEHQARSDAAAAAPPNNKPLPLAGSLRFKADSISYGRFVLNPVQAMLVLAPNEIKVEHIETALCGVTLSGSLALAGQDIRVELNPHATGLQLEPTLACLAGTDQKISGRVDVSGSFSAHGTRDALVPSFKGSAELIARDGRIDQHLTLAKVLSVVTVSDLVRGKMPDSRAKGLPFRSISLKTGLQGATLSIQELVVDSSVMNIVGQGMIDLKDDTIDLTVLVAPFTSLDQVVSKIPVVNYILQGTLVTVPVNVSGRMSDPEVKLVPASSVGDGLLGILKRTLKAPVKIMEPVLPGEKGIGDEAK